MLAEDIFKPLARIDADERDRARFVLGVALIDTLVEEDWGRSIRMGEGGLVEVVDNGIFS